MIFQIYPLVTLSILFIDINQCICFFVHKMKVIRIFFDKPKIQLKYFYLIWKAINLKDYSVEKFLHFYIYIKFNFLYVI